MLEPGLSVSVPLQTSVTLAAVAEPSPKLTRMMQHASALETSMTKRTGWPALGDGGSIRTRAFTPFLSACQEVAGGTLGVVGMVRIGGRVDTTVDGVTAFAVVAVEGRRVVVVARMVDDGDVVVGPTTAVVLVVGSSGTVDRPTSGPPAGWPEAFEVEGGESTTVAESAPAESSRVTLATRIRTACVPPAHLIRAGIGQSAGGLERFREKFYAVSRLRALRADEDRRAAWRWPRAPLTAGGSESVQPSPSARIVVRPRRPHRHWRCFICPTLDEQFGVVEEVAVDESAGGITGGGELDALNRRSAERNPCPPAGLWGSPPTDGMPYDARLMLLLIGREQTRGSHIPGADSPSSQARTTAPPPTALLGTSGAFIKRHTEAASGGR